MKPAILLAAALALAGCTREPALPVYGAVPDFSLTSQSGQPFSSRALDGKIWVANFLFTSCPGPCPRMSWQMRRLALDLRDLPQVRFVSFTVDPERDTPPAPPATRLTPAAGSSSRARTPRYGGWTTMRSSSATPMAA
jgi:cytochrome oxidase Cu insertion factor (SCO1/SenC/PrrC family)